MVIFPEFVSRRTNASNSANASDVNETNITLKITLSRTTFIIRRFLG